MSTFVRSLKRGNHLWMWSFGGLIMLTVAAISMPNLLRVRMSPEQFREYQSHSQQYEEKDSMSMSMVGSAPQTPPPLGHEGSFAGRKIIQTSALEMTVKNPIEVAEKIRFFAEGLGGYVESSQFSAENSASANLVIRVPAAKLEEAKVQLHKYAIRVDSEQTDAQDVTKRYVDTEARLRNLRAEEAQYLQIMKSAVKVQDMLDVSEKLSRVRGQIEQQQAEFATLSKQIETVAITISLRTEADANVLGFHWRPLYQLKVAVHDALEALANYASTMAAVILYLPVVRLWLATVILGASVGWWLLRWVARVFLGWKPAAAAAQ